MYYAAFVLFLVLSCKIINGIGSKTCFQVKLQTVASQGTIIDYSSKLFYGLQEPVLRGEICQSILENGTPYTLVIIGGA